MPNRKPNDLSSYDTSDEADWSEAQGLRLRPMLLRRAADE